MPTVIQAARGLVPLNLRELWEFKDLAYFFLWRDLKSRYKQMALGPIWIVLQPLLNMLVFTIVFNYIAEVDSGSVPYPLFNYSALLLWSFFARCLTTASGSLRAYKNLISKVYFPRLIVPIVGVLSALIDFFISFVILVAMMYFYGYEPTVGMLYIPLFLFLAAIAGLGIGLWIAPWVVHFWDMQNLTGFAVRALMYATPVVYSINVIIQKQPDWVTLYRCNPMVNIIEGYRWALLGEGLKPDLFLVWTMIPMALLMVGGAYYYRRAERSIVDIA